MFILWTLEIFCEARSDGFSVQNVPHAATSRFSLEAVHCVGIQIITIILIGSVKVVSIFLQFMWVAFFWLGENLGRKIFIRPCSNHYIVCSFPGLRKSTNLTEAEAFKAFNSCIGILPISILLLRLAVNFNSEIYFFILKIIQQKS